MPSLQEFRIELENAAGVYYAGQNVSGSLIVHFTEPMKMRGLRLRFEGKATVRFREKRGDKDRTYRNSHTYFRDIVVLFGKAEGEDGDDPTHPEGRHVYPFQFTLPDQLPSSFQGRYGNNRYSLVGVIDKPRSIDPECVKLFTVISQMDLNLLPDVHLPKQVTDAKMLGAICCQTGPITASLRLDRTAFVPGEFVTINAETQNNSDRGINNVSVRLKMTVVYIAHFKTKRWWQTISEISGGPIDPGDTQTFNGERMYIPALPSSTLPDSSDIIRLHYSIHLRVVPSGLSFSLDLPIGIMVGTIPLKNVQCVFADAPFNYMLPADGDANPGNAPAPVVPSNDAVRPAPPPSFQESALVDKDDDIDEQGDHMTGETSWSPKYPLYSWGK